MESWVEINIYDLKGQNIKTLINKYHSIGEYTINWNAANHSSGVYFLQYSIIENGIPSVNYKQKLMLVK